MAVDAWWVPSLIVLAFVVAGIAVLVSVLRRRSRAIEQAEQADAAARARAAAISLVRADDLVQSAADELGFAIAQFGENATREFAQALTTSRRQLRDAFALQQKLDDALPDTDAERRRWNEQIIALADEATTRLNGQTRSFESRRGVEREAPVLLAQLQRRVERAADRMASGHASIDRLALTYTDAALAALRSNAGRAAVALAEAREAAAAASARLGSAQSEPVGEQMSAAERGMFTATKLLDAIETGEDDLHIGFATLATALDAADAELAEARDLRDRHEESDARDSLNLVIAQADRVVAELRNPARLSDPAADLLRLREAMDGLDMTRSAARNRQLRLENARGALTGALLTARSQISVTRDYIGSRAGQVGAPARTRLAEAERQLSLAEAEADPVTALDTARRAMTFATDADALARYDAH
ncbi:hypothetical protein [Glaciibacter psychrotolerans]|uniref:Low affinity Fe/Cu permease n=1 Tax=Glaciibacter psychrotolerans TaxID=670054 RepID=A0A7Z0J833_9MICO|nr:hypothetical protein [Leifsonia psychrotolerans]NYJ21499.1 low affinity Fe/Cu permease [Leifsonia psychrotolerans]